MCRSIQTLRGLEPPVTDDEVRAAALQFVRKISGFTRPSQQNQETFDQAVDEVAEAARNLLEGLVVPGQRVRLRTGALLKGWHPVDRGSSVGTPDPA